MSLAMNKLRDWKQKNLMSQKTLARLLGKSQPYVSMLFCGHIKDVPDSVKLKINEVTNNFVKMPDWFKGGRR